jgi:hypothetical protein
MKPTIAAAFLAAAGPIQAAHAEAPPVQAQRALLGPMADLLLTRVGTWDVRADLRLQPGPSRYRLRLAQAAG